TRSFSYESLFPSQFAQNMFHCRGDKRDSYAGLEIEELPVVEAVEHVLDNFVFLLHQQDRFLLIKGWLSLSSTLRVVNQGFLQLGTDAHVVDNQPSLFPRIDSVHPRYCLHQGVTLYRLVKVHRVQSRGVETRQEHVSHNDQLELVLRILEIVPD